MESRNAMVYHKWKAMMQGMVISERAWLSSILVKVIFFKTTKLANW